MYTVDRRRRLDNLIQRAEDLMAWQVLRAMSKCAFALDSSCFLPSLFDARPHTGWIYGQVTPMSREPMSSVVHTYQPSEPVEMQATGPTPRVVPHELSAIEREQVQQNVRHVRAAEQQAARTQLEQQRAIEQLVHDEVEKRLEEKIEQISSQQRAASQQERAEITQLKRQVPQPLTCRLRARCRSFESVYLAVPMAWGTFLPIRPVPTAG
jgi:hypothetical protein